MNIKAGEYPPNYEEICEKFPSVRKRPGIVFTYGNDLYNPNNGHISDDLLEHEKTHARQQLEIGIGEWWRKYLEDGEFRFSQELEAYRVQYRFAKGKYNRKIHRIVLKRISKDLASPMYGLDITEERAKELIKNYD